MTEAPANSRDQTLGEVNRSVFTRKTVVSAYDCGALQAPESILFLKYREYFWNKRVLDLGCGGGRTSLVLLQCTPHFVGVDYSASMIELCRRRFPGADFREGDARDLRPFENESFDVVLFSFNGIDLIDHEDRLRALREIWRVLRPGCLFVFSSHNRNYEFASVPPRLGFARNPAAQLRLMKHYWTCRRNRVKNAPQERSEDEYAIINDLAHDYSLLHYYITRDYQARQLARCGFHLLEARDTAGNLLTGDANDANDANAPWIYYAARKTLDRG